MTEEEWTAIQNRDRNYDGVFYYGLKTTKKVMLPSCSSRLPKRENVVIFHSLEEAYEKGYVPCKKCCPNRPDWCGAKSELVESAKKLILEQYTEKFSLCNLAEALYVNESYLVRTFKQLTGSTLLEYHNKVRCEKSLEYLQNSDHNLSYISSMVGYSSSAHYIRCFERLYGCTPTQYRKEMSSHERS